MTPKELKKLSRAELLQMLLTRTREVERLEAELRGVKEQLNDKMLNISEAGDLANAVLKLNGVFDAAREAAEQYKVNIAAMEEACRQKCIQLEEAARSCGESSPIPEGEENEEERH